MLCAAYVVHNHLVDGVYSSTLLLCTCSILKQIAKRHSLYRYTSASHSNNSCSIFSFFFGHINVKNQLLPLVLLNALTPRGTLLLYKVLPVYLVTTFIIILLESHAQYVGTKTTSTELKVIIRQKYDS